jgi:hypothetical protein
MLIDAQTMPATSEETGLAWWRNERFSIGWKGHLFIPGLSAGRDSIARLADMLARSSLSDVAKDVCGVYCLLVHDGLARHWQIAVDNSSMYKVFYDSRHVSTGFLELLEARRTGAKGISAERIVEFLAHGAVYGAPTLATDVRKLRSDEIIQLPAAGGLELRPKLLPSTAGDADEVVGRHFSDLARSLAGRRLSADVTGGFDTRLIACLLKHVGLEFEAAISGRPEAEDVVIARSVAEVLGASFRLTPHNVANLEDELQTVFRAGDGLTDLRRFHRDWQNACARRSRGMDVMTHGGGGAHFKDFFCYQDFPFYGSQTTNFPRYYSLRITPVNIARSNLTAKAAEIYSELKQQTIEKFETLRQRTNNQSYDEIAFNLRAPEFYGQYFSNYINMGLDVIAPFLDYRSAKSGIDLSPWARFFSAWHRKLITKHCPALVALPTTEGYNASAAMKDLPRNLTGFIGTQTLRVAKKASQRLVGRSMFLSMGAATVDVEGFLDILRGTRRFMNALDRLKAAEILASGLAAGEVADIHVGRILTAGMLLEHLDSHA